MEGEGPSVAARQNLLDRLLDAVKQCQVYFGARQEIATETDLRVATLCAEWEAILLYGMRRDKPRGLGRQIAGLVKTDGNVSFWPLVKLYLSSEEIQRFTGMKQITSDIGRGRAWLRAAINERTMENYLHSILADVGKLQTLYDSHAFLLDEERSSMLPIMAAGLGSILFSITVDADYLNSPQRNVDVPAVVPKLRPTLQATPITTPTILDRLPHDIGVQDDSVVAVNAKEKKKKRKKRSHMSSDSPSVSPLPELEPNEEQQEPLTTTQEVGVAIQKPPAMTQEVGVAVQEGDVDMMEGSSLSSSPSQTSVNSVADEGGAKPMFVDLDPELVSRSTASIEEAEAAANATALVLSATTLRAEATAVPPGNTLTGDELREALLAMVKNKDEVEGKKRELESRLSAVETGRGQLAQELEQTREQLQAVQESHTTQQQALERENDLLRDQLKKYVGMVQAKRRDGSTRLTESLSLSDATPCDPASLDPSHLPPSEPPGPSIVCPPNSAEHKLAEMAEMYGELMELNERLHRDMANKDSIIVKLAQCIRQSGLKVPVSSKLLPPAALELLSVVDLWIPSVIKRGRGPDSHHVYQVYLKVKSEEWNVYRRYMEFREFHRQLQELVPEVGSFDFPPKKTLGSKSTQVVEERRHKLQQYLRHVVRLLMSPTVKEGGKGKSRRRGEAIIQPSITKDDLVQLLPFFKEDVEQAPRTPRSPSYSGL